LHWQVTVSLAVVVGEGRERRNHDGWFPLSGRHCDGLQMQAQRTFVAQDRLTSAV
jgi:hypothetical protein